MCRLFECRITFTSWIGNHCSSIPAESTFTDGGDDNTGSAPLTRADIPELVKVVADALSKKEPPTDPPRSAEGGHSLSGGKLILFLGVQKKERL